MQKLDELLPRAWGRPEPSARRGLIAASSPSPQSQHVGSLHRLQFTRGNMNDSVPSQALVIDVFGTINVSKDKDRILGALARECGLPDDGPWTLKLEWKDPKNLLCEPRPTQVDAIAFGSRSLLVIECKFHGCPFAQNGDLGTSRFKGQLPIAYTILTCMAGQRLGRDRFRLSVAQALHRLL